VWQGNYFLEFLDKIVDERSLTGLAACTSDQIDFYLQNGSWIERGGEKLKLIKEMASGWSYENLWKYSRSLEEEEARYDGYLVNYDKKLAVDLRSYFDRSVVMSAAGMKEYAIDLIPCLCDLCGGSSMALFEGYTEDSSVDMLGTWVFDLMGIVDDVPDGFEVVKCCFANVKSKCVYCFVRNGVDSWGHVLDDNGTPLKGFDSAGFLREPKLSEYVYKFVPIKSS
jgi:hypothetical protein